MKIIKIIIFMIMLLEAGQSCLCSVPEIQPQDLKKFVKTLIEKQKDKRLIKYDENKDEIIILSNMLESGAEILFLAMLIMASIGAAFGLMSNIYIDEAGLSLALTGIGVAIFAFGILLAIIFKIQACQNKGRLDEYLRLAPEGFKKCSDFVFSWKDVAEVAKVSAQDFLYLKNHVIPNIGRTKCVTRYKTKNGSRLFDLDEKDDPCCTISFQDLKKLITYYLEKYGV